MLALLAAGPAAAQGTSPSVPRNVSVTASNNEQLFLSWQAPSSWGSWSAAHYEIEWKLSSSNSGAWTDTDGDNPTATATSYEFSGTQRAASFTRHRVTDGTSYDLRIRACAQQPGSTGQLPSHYRCSSWVTVVNQVAKFVSADAYLASLTASTSTSATGTFTALTLTPLTWSIFTTSFAATVPYARTHAKVTPTLSHSAATVAVQGTTVTSGSASGVIALSVGANAITVEVTAEDGTTTQTNTVTITRQAAGAPPAVSLSASPNPVTEGSSVTVTALLSKALSAAVTIPLTLTAGTAESGDHGSLASITIASGTTSGTGAITTNQDADFDNEIFTVSLDTANLPASVTAGSPASVVITIEDDDAPPVAPPPDGGPAGIAPYELPPGPVPNLVAAGPESAPASPAGAAAIGSAGSVAVPRGNAAGLPGPGIDPEELHRHEEAIADCSEAIRLDPRDPALYLERAEARSAVGRFEEALADYDRAIRLDPDHAGAYLGRCRAKSELGRHEEAVEDYDHAVRLDPDSVAA